VSAHYLFPPKKGGGWMSQPMHILEHVADLRKRILMILGTFLVSLIGCFLFVDHIYDFLAAGSKEALTILGPTDISE
jgi:sec-independent protein translocase protein TatC